MASDFIILPTRLRSGGNALSEFSSAVLSLNGKSGELILSGTSDINITSVSNGLQIGLSGSITGNYIQKSGDTIQGRLKFVTTDNTAGLKLGNRTSDPTSPNSEAGDIYYKTDTNVIRYYDGTAWTTVGGFTTTDGDARYLRLNGGTLTGALTISNGSMLNLGSRQTSPVSGMIAGSFYYNEQDGRPYFYDGVGSAWRKVGVGDGTASYPTQTGQSGKFLTTNGSNVSWGTPSLSVPLASTTVSGSVKTDVNDGDPLVYLKESVDALLGGKEATLGNPGTNGFLLASTTTGTRSWVVPFSLPSQTSNNGKFLTTNGTTASWVDAPTEIPSQASNSGKYLTTNGTALSWATVAGGGGGTVANIARNGTNVVAGAVALNFSTNFIITDAGSGVVDINFSDPSLITGSENNTLRFNNTGALVQNPGFATNGYSARMGGASGFVYAHNDSYPALWLNGYDLATGIVADTSSGSEGINIVSNISYRDEGSGDRWQQYHKSDQGYRFQVSNSIFNRGMFLYHYPYTTEIQNIAGVDTTVEVSGPENLLLRLHADDYDGSHVLSETARMSLYVPMYVQGTVDAQYGFAKNGAAGLDQDSNGVEFAGGILVTGTVNTRQPDKIMLIPMTGFTPTSTGGHVMELTIPFNSMGYSANFDILWCNLRVATAGGTPEIILEKSSGTGAFSATTILTITMTTGQYEANRDNTSTAIGTVTTGDKIRVNVTNLGSGAAGFTTQVLLREAL